MLDRSRLLVALALSIVVASCAADAGETPPPAPLAAATVSGGRAPVVPFTPPSPRGCSAAASFDYCFAFDGGTPLAVRVSLPAAPPANAHGVVRFHRADGTPAAVLDDVEFVLPVSKPELVFYFQVYPATYMIDVTIAGATGSTDPVDVGTEPIETSLRL